MTDNNLNTSSNNPQSETELPGFSTLKNLDMDTRKRVNDKNYMQN